MTAFARMHEWPAWQRWAALVGGWVVYLAAFAAVIAIRSLALRAVAVVVLLAALVVLAYASRAVLNERVRKLDRWKVRVMAPAFVVYIVLTLYVYPLAPRMSARWLQVLLALSPMLPLVVVVWAAARYVARGDELERRQHLESLGIAVLVVAVASMALGFVAAAGLVTVNGAPVLLLMFPAICLVYGLLCAWSKWWNRAR